MSWEEALADATDRLAAAGIEDARGETEKLRRLAFPRPYVDYDEGQDGRALVRFQENVARRANREPFSHIAGGRAFWKHRFKVTPDVLDPRPDTETLVELALSEPFERVLDLGTGTGCIVISLLSERLDATGLGTDISGKALAIAAENARTADVDHLVELQKSNWFDTVMGKFDLIVSNPPYISAGEMVGLQPEVLEFEPHLALTDFGDGLSAYRAIVADVQSHLTPGGRLLVEIGRDQAESVSELLSAAGLEKITCQPDLSGKDRVVAARAPLCP